MADLERAVPNAPTTVFDAGSVAKQFTAAAVLLLERDGKLSLDDPVHKYVPELPDYGVPITIRQMLHHTSGLREWNVLATIAGIERGTFETGYGQILDIQRRQRSLNFAPGTRWSYSNSGYSLAAIIVSRVSGVPFADFTASRIFQPLGMKDTSWQQDVKRLVKNRALGYSERQGAFAVDMPIVAVDGSGGLWTTVDDLLKWNANFVRPVVGDAALIRELQRNATFGDGRTHEYAMGLVVDTYRGVPEADHGGAFAGYRAYLSRYPDQQASIAVLCNAAGANPTAHGKALAQVLLGAALRAPSPTPTPTVSFNEADAEKFAGMYRRSPQAGAIRIVRDGTALLFNGGTRLVPISQTRLMRADNGDTMDFDGSGRARYVDEFGTVDIYERVAAAAPTVDQLRAFVGDYFSEEIDTTFTFAVEDNRLVIRRRSERNVLTPLYADVFSSPIGEIAVVIVFERNSSGQVTGFTLTHERVWNLRFTRVVASNARQ
jgi:CubicO group peptidase (beta-lactamase class C family)